MSVSAGPTKEKFKSFHIRLTTIDMYGNNIDPPKSLSNKIKIQPWTRCKELKTFISNNTGISSKNICLFFKNTELSDNLTMYDYNVIESKDPIISYQIQTKQKDFSIRVYGGFHCHLILKKVIEEICDENEIEFFDYEATGLSIGGVYYGYYYAVNNEIAVPDFYGGNNLGEQYEADGGTYFGKPNNGTDWCFIKKITNNWYYYELHWG